MNNNNRYMSISFILNPPKILFNNNNKNNNNNNKNNNENDEFTNSLLSFQSPNSSSMKPSGWNAYMLGRRLAKVCRCPHKYTMPDL